MDLDLDQLADAVLRLSVAARAELAARLLESLDEESDAQPPKVVAAAWEAELDRREAELVAEPSLAVPAEEAFRRVAASLAARGAGAREGGR